MGRQVLGVVVGILVGGVVIALVEALGHMIFPTAAIEDISQFANVMSRLPLGAKAFVILAWGTGIFVGGLTSLKISGGQRQGPPWPAWAVAAVLFGGAVWTMFQFPHPTWMIVASIMVTLLGAWGAGRLMQTRS